ncbi:MAG: hypothetical protein HY470_01615, partial [Candidatus Ryanbacteria bacterium]|nr:hypothetical protein [Candidatus Ryanbacteria bacterium]
RNDAKQCGTTALDLPGTLQGNWFYGNARADMGDAWDKHLAFVYDNENPERAIVSVGGKFTSAGKWEFVPQSSGRTNRAFKDIVPASGLYCFEGKGPGKILVELLTENELKIEHQSGACLNYGAESFTNPTTYKR